MLIRTTGLLLNDKDRASAGFTIFSPLFSKETYLIGMQGDIRHTWQHPNHPGNYAYLLETGNLLWSGETAEGPCPGGGKGGLMREYTWDGDIIWEHRDDAQHHDFRRLRNDNTMYLGWEPLSDKAAARVIGAEPGSEKNGVMWGDFLKEVDAEGKIVWEWHIEDHFPFEDFPLNPLSTRGEFAHANSLQELPDGNILLSFRKISAVAIVDRKSGAVIWHHRDEKWGQQHDAQMLDNGNIMLFANGIHVPSGVFGSEIVEFDPETRERVWVYRGSPFYSFFSPHISGAQRLCSGNTLICEGMNGRFFEVTPSGEIVWEYINPRFAPGMEGMSNSVFRAYRYLADSPQIAGRLGAP